MDMYNKTESLKPGVISMTNDDKIPIALEAIWNSLEDISKTLSDIAGEGLRVRQISRDCMSGYHKNDPFDGCESCGCDCHT